MNAIKTPQIDLGWRELFGLGDHFRSLGLSRDASPDEVNERIVSRAASLLDAPDAEAEIARLEKVRDMLLDPARRAAYVDAVDRAPRFVGVSLALAFVVFGYVYFNWNSFPATPAPADAFDAYTACTGFVGKRLKAPASARYQEYRDVAISHPAGGGFRVRGYVDSQNGFGAMLRTQWDCEVAFEGRTARLKNLTLD